MVLDFIFHDSAWLIEFLLEHSGDGEILYKIINEENGRTTRSFYTCKWHVWAIQRETEE